MCLSPLPSFPLSVNQWGKVSSSEDPPKTSQPYKVFLMPLRPRLNWAPGLSHPDSGPPTSGSSELARRGTELPTHPLPCPAAPQASAGWLPGPAPPGIPRPGRACVSARLMTARAPPPRCPG